MAKTKSGVAVLGLDALDNRMVDIWELENLKLDRSAKIETFSYSIDYPRTTEVWPTIATGVHPKEHGVNTNKDLRWNNPILEFGGKFSRYLPNPIQGRLRDTFINDSHRTEVKKVDYDHMFEIGHVYEWPGVSDAPHFGTTRSFKNMDYSEQEYRELLYGHTGKEVGWLTETIRSGSPLAGVQCHILDFAGHAYAKREKQLKKYYKYMDKLVGHIRQRMGPLLIVSDHGMQTSFLNDPNPGKHSWHAHCAVEGLDGNLPEDVFGIREFVESNVEHKSDVSEDLKVDTPEQHLRELGYIE